MKSTRQIGSVLLEYHHRKSTLTVMEVKGNLNVVVAQVFTVSRKSWDRISARLDDPVGEIVHALVEWINGRNPTSE